MKGDWQYAGDASRSRVGLMFCNACHRPIIDGEFRYRDVGEAYVTQHRACTLQDYAWKRRNALEAERVAKHKARLAAFEAFRNLWGADQLDEEIGGLRADIAAHDAILAERAK